jgi:hypothetical protein
MAHGVHRGEQGGLEDDRRTDERKNGKEKIARNVSNDKHAK